MAATENDPRALSYAARPQIPAASFVDLIGQEPDGPDPDQRIPLNRIAQAYMLTGVRGVGRRPPPASSPAPSLFRSRQVEQPTIDMV